MRAPPSAVPQYASDGLLTCSGNFTYLFPLAGLVGYIAYRCVLDQRI